MREVEYFLYDGKGSIGPFEAGELAKHPGFDTASLVFPVGATSPDAWKPAGSFPELMAALKLAALPPATPLSPWLAKVPSKSAAEQASPSDKLVLVVDDDENVRSFIELSAKMQGFQVVTAVNGLDAMAKLAAGPADLIVTDLMMPGQGGYEFLRSLQSATGPRVPVFVVTGSALDDSTIEMIRQEANVVEFVAKPLTMAPFVKALHKHLGTKPP